MLNIQSIFKKYSSEVFYDFSYVFDENKIYFLSGRNGSGKTTLLKLIKGIYLCDEGKIRFKHDLNQRNDVVYIDSNSRTFFHRLTVRQNLEYFFSLQSADNDFQSLDELLKHFDLLNLQDKIFSSLSQGQMQMISIVRGFSSRPKVILLDEVFSSLDENYKKMIFDYLAEFASESKSLVIFTSHQSYHNKISFTELCLS